MGEDLVEAITTHDLKEDEAYHKYRTHRGTRGGMISYINELKVQFVIQVPMGKVMQKCRKYVCPMGLLFVVDQCTQGINMHCTKYLLQEFIEDFLET